MSNNAKIFGDDRYKFLRSESYNYTFDMVTGDFSRWGYTVEDDPVWSPFGPEIMDIEISSGSGCPISCKFCSPAGTPVNTPDGKVSIENLKAWDSVIGFNIEKNRPQLQTIQKTYSRKYVGDIVCIETENGILKLTPEHEVYTKNRGWLEAKNLVESDELISF